MAAVGEVVGRSSAGEDSEAATEKPALRVIQAQGKSSSRWLVKIGVNGLEK